MSDPASCRRVGYCTNVHAGASLEDLLSNLKMYAPAIRSQLAIDGPLPIGLWLSRDALTHVLRDGVECLKDELNNIGVSPFTINGFPYGDFHEPVVKHRVYTPNWSTLERLVYTLDLAEVLAQLLPSGSTGGISTLPIAWGDASPECLSMAAGNLRRATEHLAVLEDRRGTCLHIDLEPEPGCVLQRSDDVVQFFEDHLLVAGQEDTIRRHLRVCHDTCHASVMFEPQAEAMANYDRAGIDIGKVQVSSALEATVATGQDPLTDLQAFAEPRWLHQTCRRLGTGLDFYEDLPAAMEAGPIRTGETLRVHFHVPVHIDRLGALSTTQADLQDAIRILGNRTELTDWEVETYAWGALPARFELDDLAAGIAAELQWTHDQLEHSQ